MLFIETGLFLKLCNRDERESVTKKKKIRVLVILKVKYLCKYEIFCSAPLGRHCINYKINMKWIEVRNSCRREREKS